MTRATAKQLKENFFRLKADVEDPNLSASKKGLCRAELSALYRIMGRRKINPYSKQKASVP